MIVELGRCPLLPPQDTLTEAGNRKLRLVAGAILVDRAPMVPDCKPVVYASRLPGHPQQQGIMQWLGDLRLILAIGDILLLAIWLEPFIGERLIADKLFKSRVDIFNRSHRCNEKLGHTQLGYVLSELSNTRSATMYFPQDKSQCTQFCQMPNA